MVHWLVGLAGGLATDSFRGAVIGALVGGVGGTIADTMVEVVNYSMITDLQISEKASGHVVNESSNASLNKEQVVIRRRNGASKVTGKNIKPELLARLRKQI